MSEAVTNAIMHGSGSSQDEVELAAREEAGRWCSRSATRATASRRRRTGSSALDEGGRGLELISLMMDEVQLTRGDDGSVLRFSKDLAA